MSEPAKIEQLITEFFAKSLHIILEARSPYVNSRNYNTSSSSSSTGQLRDEWLRDYPSSLEDFDLCRQSNLEPLVIDVVLTQMEHKREKIVERWFVQYKTRKSSNVARKLHFGDTRRGGSNSHSPEISLYEKIYVDAIILLRSLCSTVRLLPAYKVFQNLNLFGCPFSLSHKISSFAEPFTRAEDAEMDRFSFTPVETFFGRLSLSVLYVITLEDLEPFRTVSAQFIPDYVGSPRTERLKKLSCVPSAGWLPSISRRHSWTVDRGITPSTSPFPSPTYSDSHTMQCSRNPGLPLRSHLPDCLPSTPLAHTKKWSINQYWLSPPFSPSNSPSAPTNLPNIHLKNVLLRTECAPLSAPLLRLKGSSGVVNQALPPSHRAQAATCSHTSPGRKVQLKKKLGEVFSGMNLQKMLYCRKDEFVNLHGRKMSSCTSLQIPTRSSSRLSLLNKFDDSNFVCPFACDDEDSRGLCRIEVSDADSNAGDTSSSELIAVRRSTDAAVGVLVQMLKTALPLRHDLINTIISSQANKEELWITKRVKNNKQKEDGVVKTASNLVSADAIGELRRYMEIKELLLSKRGYHKLNISPARKPVSEVTEAGPPSLDVGETKKTVSEGIEGGPHSFSQAKN